MPTDIIEMFWGCTTCKGENLGRYKTCRNCGKPRTADCPEWMPDDVSPMAAVRDEKLLEKFEGGEDVKCRFCGTSQFRADGSCAQCGSTLAQSEPQSTNSVIQSVIESAQKRSVSPAETTSTVSEAVVPPSSRRRFPKEIVLGALGVLALIAVFYLLFRTKELDVTVQGVSWTRSVAVERYSAWPYEGWSPDYGAINIQDQGRRVHHYDHVRVGSHTEHYTEQVACGQTCRTVKGTCSTTPRSCRSNKNGSATCTGGDRVCSSDTQSCTTKYCSKDRTRSVDDYEDVPRYADWYSWDMMEWHTNRTVTESGTTTDQISWPSNAKIALGQQERLGDRRETYNVRFQQKSDTWDYAPPNEDGFSRFKVGSTHRIKVGVARGVEVLQ